MIVTRKGDDAGDGDNDGGGGDGDNDYRQW